MCVVLEASEVRVGFHPDGFRIDKTANAINRYTQWKIKSGNLWRSPKPVCFHSLPLSGWIAADKFDWENVEDFTEEFE